MNNGALNSAAERLNDAVLELLWSAWTELGVPGNVVRRHKLTAIDPEPLIAWTPKLAANEPRLLHLAFDWCVAHSHHIAKVRLAGLAKTLPEDAVLELGRFNGALASHQIQWRPSTVGSQLDVTRKTMALPIEHVALVRFRIRALCGASTRAEILAALVAAADRFSSAAELAPHGVTRRSVELVLAELVTAGLVTSRGGVRSRRFQLREQRAFVRVVQGNKLRWPDWHQLLTLAASLQALSQHPSQSVGLRRVEATRRWEAMSKLASDLQLKPPPGPLEREDIFEAMLAWGTAILESPAALSPRAPGSPGKSLL